MNNTVQQILARIHRASKGLCPKSPTRYPQTIVSKRNTSSAPKSTLLSAVSWPWLSGRSWISNKSCSQLKLHGFIIVLGSSRIVLYPFTLTCTKVCWQYSQCAVGLINSSFPWYAEWLLVWYCSVEGNEESGELLLNGSSKALFNNRLDRMQVRESTNLQYTVTVSTFHKSTNILQVGAHSGWLSLAFTS